MTSALAVEILDATVFVDPLNCDIDLAGVVGEVVGGGGSADGVRAEVLMSVNEDADRDRAVAWPGGFLYFPLVIEVYANPAAPREERAVVTARLLSALWSRGIAAVAACEYDDLLPAASGTGDRDLPWPARAS
ncbi:MAG: hypothetical protein WCB04_06260 [Mycobacteriales bacterium]